MAESVRYLMFLVGTFYFLQAMGGNPGLHTQALQKFLKEILNFSPSQSAAFYFFVGIPWMIKPVYGIISDFLPILKYRRKSYFIIMGVLSAGSYWWLANSNLTEQALLFSLFTAYVGFAFSDVLSDAVMIEKGQPLQATDRLQATQWAMLGAAGVIIAFSKGYIAQYLSFPAALKLSAIAPIVMIFFAAFALKEKKAAASGETAKQALSGLKIAVRSKPLWGAAFFLFFFNMSPNLGSVFYYYEKDTLKFSDVLIGHIDTVGSVGFLIGTALFGVLAKRFSHETLIRWIIISGVVSTLAYLFFQGVISGVAVTALASIVGVIAFLGTLTIAAKVCPKNAEGTVFAMLMAINNLGTNVGSIIGGKFYESLGYSWLIVISAAATACMWFFLPLVRQKNS